MNRERGCVPLRPGMAIGLVLSLTSVLMAAFPVSANPIVIPPGPDSSFSVRDGASGIIGLFMMNVFVNLAFYTLFMVPHAKGLGLGTGRPSALRMLSVLLIIVFVITAMGAVVDYYFIMQGRSLIHESYRYISYDPVSWFIALTLIFLSVVLPTSAVLKNKLWRSWAVGAEMCAVNLRMWSLSGELGYDVPFVAIIGSLLLSPVLIKVFVNKYAGGTAPESDAIPEVAIGSDGLVQTPANSYRKKSDEPEQD